MLRYNRGVAPDVEACYDIIGVLHLILRRASYDRWGTEALSGQSVCDWWGCSTIASPVFTPVFCVVLTVGHAIVNRVSAFSFLSRSWQGLV